MSELGEEELIKRLINSLKRAGGEADAPGLGGGPERQRVGEDGGAGVGGEGSAQDERLAGVGAFGAVGGGGGDGPVAGVGVEEALSRDSQDRGAGKSRSAR